MFGLKKKIDKPNPTTLVKDNLAQVWEIWSGYACWLKEAIDSLPEQRRRIQTIDDLIYQHETAGDKSQEFLSTMKEVRDWLEQEAEMSETAIVDRFKNVKAQYALVKELRKQLDERNA